VETTHPILLSRVQDTTLLHNSITIHMPNSSSQGLTELINLRLILAATTRDSKAERILPILLKTRATEGIHLSSTINTLSIKRQAHMASIISKSDTRHRAAMMTNVDIRHILSRAHMDKLLLENILDMALCLGNRLL
jgi:hypothetical protein